MKKIKLAIIFIYVFTFIIVTFLTVYFVSKIVKKSMESYFREYPKQSELSSLTNQKEINQILDVLRKLKIINQ